MSRPREGAKERVERHHMQIGNSRRKRPKTPPTSKGDQDAIVLETQEESDSRDDPPKPLPESVARRRKALARIESQTGGRHSDTRGGDAMDPLSHSNAETDPDDVDVNKIIDTL